MNEIYSNQNTKRDYVKILVVSNIWEKVEVWSLMRRVLPGTVWMTLVYHMLRSGHMQGSGAKD